MEKQHYGDLTYYQHVSNLRPGNYIVLNYKPCKIVNINNKINIKAIDIITGEEINRTFRIEDEINVPHFDVYEYDVLGLNNNKIILKHKNEIEEYKLPSYTAKQREMSKIIIDNLLNN